jgi:predicted O-linked N-acetylglucosamine transferase (SPINDLY family)
MTANIHVSDALSPEQALERAVAHHRAGELHEAARLYGAVLQVQPEHAEANFGLGSLAVALNQFDAALPRFEAALNADPTRRRYWLVYIEALVGAGQTEEARSTLALARRHGLEGADVDELAARLIEHPTAPRATTDSNGSTGNADQAPATTTAPAPSEVNAVVALFARGRYAEAEHAARELTTRNPRNGFGWMALGATLKQMGRSSEALVPAQTAVDLLPDNANAHSNLGGILKDLGRLQDAEANLRSALRINPHHIQALINLGATLQGLDQPHEAELLLQRVLRIDPNSAEALCNLGNVFVRQRRLDDAERCFRRALEINPALAEAHFTLGATLQEQNRFEDAEVSYRRAITIKPDYAMAHCNLGVTLLRLGYLGESETSCRRALEINPDFPDAHINLGATLLHMGRLLEAEQCCRAALKLAPDSALTFSNLGVALQDLGQHQAAQLCYRRALDLQPDSVGAMDNLLFDLNYDPDKSAEEIFAVYREYDTRFALPLRREWKRHTNNRVVDRRLRVGYVSPDFKQHSAQRFLEPLLSKHDKSVVEVYAYAELVLEDAVTARYRSYVDHWVPTRGLTDAELAERIRADAIDILVELAGHTNGNRLGVFARKPAPVSLTWMGYGNTTGVSAIDYFLTDDTGAPPGSDSLFAERPWRIANPDIPFRPAEGMGDINVLPALTNGFVTFCTLTRRIRINHRTIRVWSEILTRVSNARLVINSKDFLDTSAQNLLAGEFAAHGIARDRLLIGCQSPPWDVLRNVDVGLDCFPHNSGTTLLETLYMGVPYVTLADRVRVGRIGGSMVRAAGHPEWIAESEQEYIDKAVALASDLPALARIRSQLRHEMQNGPLMDEAGFARRVEAAYREMFRRWAQAESDDGLDVDGMLHQAVALHAAGQLQQAGELYRAILAAYPHHAKANHNLGTLAVLMRQPDAGLPFLQAALDAEPACAQFWISYIDALFRTGQHDEARRLLALARAQGLDGEAVDELAARLDTPPQAQSATLSSENPDGKDIEALTGAYSAGRFAEAAAQATTLTETLPQQPLPWMVLGMALNALGRSDDALEPARKAAELAPRNADAHLNLGLVYKALGRIDDARDSYAKAIRIEPALAEAHFNLGNALKVAGRPDDAAASYREAIRLRPGLVAAHFNLGAIQKSQGRYDDAETSYRRALQLAPGDALLHAVLGGVLMEQGRATEAEVEYRRALELDPRFVEAQNNLANLLLRGGRQDEAEAMLRHAVELRPDYAEAHFNLGNILMTASRYVEARRCFERALEINPRYLAAHQNLVTLLGYMSDFDAVIARSDATLALDPTAAISWEQRLYTFSYHPDLSAAQIFAEFTRWGERYPPPAVDFGAHDRTPGRRLRVGFVSPDFRKHTSRFYFMPMFANHDRNAVELFAYSNVFHADEATAKFKSVFDHWRNIRGVSAHDAAQMIRDDRIDILVDGCNHMLDDRLDVFKLKPAPIQVTWLGAAWTTGLKQIDYVLFDPYIAPEGTLSAETIVRLPHCFIAYEPEVTVPVAPPPALKNGYITFGYSGRTERLNRHTFRVWGEILRRIPDARLILDYRCFADPPTQEHYRQLMRKHGMDPERVIMRRSANIFEGLHDVDVLLDCFPHSGGTMLLDALLMGVPALTLAGRPPLGRIGTTFMTNLGLPEWIATSHDDYIDKAVELTRDVNALASLRAAMRERMRRSPLMDGPGFARAVETAYRAMYDKWRQQ